MKRGLLVVALVVVAALMHAQNNSPLCFTARNGSVTVRFNIRNVTHTIQYSTDGSSWSTYASGTDVTIGANQSVYFRAETNQTVATAFFDYFTTTCSGFYFSSSTSGTVEGSGNIMSLYGPDCPDLPLQPYAFAVMFEECTLLTQAPALPATTLAEGCYNQMFYGCTLLTQAPALPATTLAEGCYKFMFYGCTSLTQAPVLLATTLADYCYENMFKKCTSLTQAPALPATTLADYCYFGMFCNCTSLTQAPALPATTLAEGCYVGMFERCASLTQAPALPATILANYCYNGMFEKCSSLVVNTEAPGKEWMIPATTTATDALDAMFTGTGGTMNGTPSVNTTYYIASDPTTAAEYVEVEHEYIVFTEGNGIVVSGAAEVSICDAAGRVVFDGKVEDEMARFEVSVAGVYFVRCDGKETYRIVVK